MTGRRSRVGLLIGLLAVGLGSAATAHPKVHQDRSGTGPSIPPPPPPPPPQPPPPPPPTDYVIYFSFDGSAITPEAQAILAKAAADVASIKSLDASYRTQMVAYEASITMTGREPSPPPPDPYAPKAVIVGYADTSGSAAYNLGLSERRAKAAADAFVGLGLPLNRIAVSWKGEADPAVATGDDVREPLNRRVTVQVAAGANN